MGFDQGGVISDWGALLRLYIGLVLELQGVMMVARGCIVYVEGALLAGSWDGGKCVLISGLKKEANVFMVDRPNPPWLKEWPG